MERIIFILVLLSFCLPIAHGDHEKCSIYEVSSMKILIRYKPYKTNANDGKIAERRVKTTEIPINSQGENGTVYVGYIEATKKCVAVKVINELDEYENALNVSDKIQEMLSRKNRTHIIEMIDAGRRLGVSDSVKQGIFVFELGTLSFAEMVYGASLTYQNDDELGRMARRIAIPMSEFHQVAMHLDVKPENFVLTKREIERRNFLLKENISEDVFKIVDFNGAQLVKSVTEKGQTSANEKNWPEIRIHSAIYNSPEYFTSLIVSTKTDIWSIGVIMLELLLLHRFYSENNSFQKSEKSEITNQLIEVVDLYRGFTLKKIINSKEYEKNSPVEYFSNKIWLLKYYESIGFILQFWKEFPKMAILITNLLTPNRNFRMTANGILEFIAGRCVPAEIKNAQNMQQFSIFNRVLFGDFVQILEEWQNELEQNSADDEQIEKRKEVSMQKREKLTKMANIVTKRQDKVHKELIKCRNLCETGI